MRKISLFVLFWLLSFSPLFAGESGFVFRPFFGGGGGTAVFDGAGGYGLGGIGEFAFLFFQNGNGFQISSHIIGRGDTVNAASGIRYGSGAAVKKFSFGGFLPSRRFRSYAFAEGGIGFGSGNGKTAFNFIFGGGGGFDFFFHQKGSLYLEVGYLQHFINNNLVGGVSITVGSRGWF